MQKSSVCNADELKKERKTEKGCCFDFLGFVTAHAL